MDLANRKDLWGENDSGAVICSDPGEYWGKLSHGHATPRSPDKHVTAASLGCLPSEKMEMFPNLNCHDAYEEIAHSLFLFIVLFSSSSR